MSTGSHYIHITCIYTCKTLCTCNLYLTYRHRLQVNTVLSHLKDLCTVDFRIHRKSRNQVATDMGQLYAYLALPKFQGSFNGSVDWNFLDKESSPSCSFHKGIV